MALFVRSEDELIENAAAHLHREEEESHGYTKPSLVSRIREYLPFRLLRVLLNDPAALLFVISLFVFSICMPFLGLYLKHSENLLDLDTMKVWNSFIGHLYQKHFSVAGPINSSLITSTVTDCTNCDSVCVRLRFDVGKELLDNSNISILSGNFSGVDLKTNIQDSDGNKVDNIINLHILLDIGKSRNDCLSNRHCKSKAYVIITAPTGSIGFTDLVKPDPSYRKPPDDFVCSPSNIPHYYRDMSAVYNMTLSRYKSLVKTTGTQVRKHGLILIYISQDDQDIAARRIYKASIMFVGLALAFLIGLSCTGNSSDSQSQTERSLNSYHNE